MERRGGEQCTQCQENERKREERGEMRDERSWVEATAWERRDQLSYFLLHSLFSYRSVQYPDPDAGQCPVGTV